MKFNLKYWFRNLVGIHPDTPESSKSDCASECNPQDWVAAGTHCGRVRVKNEDNYLCAPERGLFVVADGMGGHAAGEKASAVVISRINELLSSERIRSASSGQKSEMETLLQRTLEDVNNSILSAVVETPEWEGMGSTAVVALIRDSILHVINCGDSRAYLHRGETLQKLTHDHSVTAMMVEQGEITEEEARLNPQRNSLTSALGVSATVDADYYVIPLQPGDRVILCSDGLWDMLRDDVISQYLAAANSPSDAVRNLLDAANDAGGKDNITVVSFYFYDDVTHLAHGG